MKFVGIRIRNFRTIALEQSIDLNHGATIVGPNSSGKTNILKAIEMMFTGYENTLKYDVKNDLTFGVVGGQTSLVATFSGDRKKEDKEFFVLYDELASMLEDEKVRTNTFSLYLSFTKAGKTMYRFFSNEKMKKEFQAQFSRKQIIAVNTLLDKFVCHYVPSSKSINDLYRTLLLPFIKRAVSRVLEDKLQEINESLITISDHLDNQLKIAGLSHINSHFSLPNGSLEDLLHQFEFHLSDPNKTSISRKGMGIQATAILASFLWITKEEKLLDKAPIWLIEEPESYLHPELAEACHKMLSEIGRESLLVTTTHSLGFVSQDPKKIIGTKLDNNVTKIIKYTTYVEATSSIRSALGVRFSDYYNLGLLNVFVEGQSDREIFQWVLEVIEPQRDGTYTWKYVREAEFLDFSGVSGMEGFMKATYEFIYKERPVITVLDGDTAGDKTRRNLQQYLGNKNVPFQANVDFVSLHNGFSLEGLFPHSWIINAYEEHPTWFTQYSVDVEGKLQPFSMRNNKNKTQLRNYLIEKARDEADYDWAERFSQVFNALDKALCRAHLKIYGHDI